MVMSEDHASCWVHKDLTSTTKRIRALLTVARVSGAKDESQSSTDRYRAEILDGHSDQHIRRLQFPRHRHSG